MRIIGFLNEHFEEAICSTLMAVMVVLICIQVVSRYCLEISLAWSEELARYMFIWMVYIGIAYGIKKRKHLCVDVVRNFIPLRQTRYFDFIGDALFLFFAVFVANKATEVFFRIIASGQHSPACELPMWIVYGALPFGMALSSLRILQNMLSGVKELRQQHY